MSTPTQRAGAARLRWLVLAASLLAVTALTVRAQEQPKSDDRDKFEKAKSGSTPATAPESKAVFEKYAKYYVGRLNDPDVQRGNAERSSIRDMSGLIADLDRRLTVPPHNYPLASTYYSRLKPEAVKTFVDEFGKVMIANLEEPALQSGKVIVRINAARMAAEVARSGYDGSAELFLKILAKPNESDAVKFWALRGLRNLFEIVPEPDIAPQKTIFEKTNTAELPELERHCIQALTDFIFRKPEIAPDTPPAQVEALRYVRREAIRALAHVRVQTVKVLGKVEARPALALLKAARGDGLVPPPNVSEIVEATVGFCQIKPSRDRDIQLDYAVNHVARAIYTVANYRVNNAKDTSVPWKLTGARLHDALDTFRRNANDSKLDNANLVSALFTIADEDIFKPLEEGAEGVPLNLGNLAQWLRDNPPKSTSLFKDDAGSVINIKE